MSTAELKSFVDHASDDEKRFIYRYLANMLNGSNDESRPGVVLKDGELVGVGGRKVTGADVRKMIEDAE